MNKLLLGAGAMKAGTTWLYKVLQQNKGVFFTPEKEIHFLSDYYRGTNALSLENRYNKAKGIIEALNDQYKLKEYSLSWYGNYCSLFELDFNWYRSLFQWNKRGAWNADFSNWTCLLDYEHWMDLKSNVDELKVIYILRDPAERLWSHIKFHHHFTGEKIDFDDWSVSQFENFITIKHINENIHYFRNISTMKKALNESELLVMKMEDIMDTPVKKLNEIERFIGINQYPYSENIAEVKVNSSSKKVAPKNFYLACDGIINNEKTRLRQIGIKY